MDVWFDSGLTHTTLERQQDGLNFPVDLYLEGSDQHRGWFQSSLLTSIALHGKPPYKGLLTHGFTVDKHGRKMSKSEGNNIEPKEIYDTLGADVLRLWIASSDYRQEMSISKEIFQRVSDVYRRIRNTLRYFTGNLYDFDADKHRQQPHQLLKLDAWMLRHTQALQEQIVQHYEHYEFHFIVRKVQLFCSNDLGAFYLDIIKDRLYTCQTDSQARRSAQTVLWHILQAMTRWLAPILSFTADEVWQEIHRQMNQPATILFADTFHSFPDALIPDALNDADETFNDEYWQGIQTLKERSDKQLELLRQDNQIGSSLDAEVSIYANPDWYDKLRLVGDELRFLLITSYAHLLPIDQLPQGVEAENGIAIVAQSCPYQRCARSWHRRQDVGHHPEHKDLDQRSIDNVYGDGEVRYFA